MKKLSLLINKEAIRGVTILDGTGWYSHENMKIIMSVIRKKETSQMFRKIREINPEAFITIESVMGVFGKGFNKIKLEQQTL